MSATDGFTSRYAEPTTLSAAAGDAVIPPRPVLLMTALGLLASVCAMLAGVDLGNILAALS